MSEERISSWLLDVNPKIGWIKITFQFNGKAFVVDMHAEAGKVLAQDIINACDESLKAN